MGTMCLDIEWSCPTMYHTSVHLHIVCVPLSAPLRWSKLRHKFRTFIFHAIGNEMHVQKLLHPENLLNLPCVENLSYATLHRFD